MYAQRCSDLLPHEPHPVPGASDRTGFTCNGAPTAEEQRLTAAFGPVPRWWSGDLPGLGVMRLPLP